jgi:hypothetical protein
MFKFWIERNLTFSEVSNTKDVDQTNEYAENSSVARYVRVTRVGVPER